MTFRKAFRKETQWLIVNTISPYHKMAKEIADMASALQKIANLPLIDYPKNREQSNPRLRAHRVAVGALKRHEKRLQGGK